MVLNTGLDGAVSISSANWLVGSHLGIGSKTEDF